MDSKILIADPKKCTGCRSCEIVCSLGRTGVSNPARARIRVINWQNKGLFLPVSCQHCEDAPCRKACPQEAISRDAALDRVVTDYSKCVGCRTCVYACPFGAMKFDADRGRPFKCDLCGGEPLCVAICEDKALAYADPTAVPYPRAREMARVYKRPFNRNI
jgi:carbon-monoxide dehydrogenase iron sulfur subunit